MRFRSVHLQSLNQWYQFRFKMNSLKGKKTSPDSRIAWPRGRFQPGVDTASAYIDDWLIIAPSADQAMHARNFVVPSLLRLGWHVHEVKSAFEPVHKCVYFGAKFNLLSHTMGIADEGCPTPTTLPGVSMHSFWRQRMCLKKSRTRCS